MTVKHWPLKPTLLIGCSLSSAAAFFATLALTYCSGRWGNPSFLEAEICGLLLAALGAGLVIALLKGKTRSDKAVALCLSLGTVIALCLMTRGLLLRTYVAGFEKAALNAASAAQWDSVLISAEHWLANPGGRQWDSSMLPSFVGTVYPNNIEVCSVVTAKTLAARDSCVFVWWRRPGYCVGLEIGSVQPKRSDALHRNMWTSNIVVVAFP